jgi:hypothetical protein
MTLVVIRVVYADDVPISVSAPRKFEGETARTEASWYVRRMLNAGLRERETNHRVEYYVLPVGDSECPPARLKSMPVPKVPVAPIVALHTRATVPEIRITANTKR